MSEPKKIALFIGSILIGALLYLAANFLLFMLLGKFFNIFVSASIFIAYLTPIFYILHVWLSYKYIFKEKKTSVLITIFALFILHTIIGLTPFTQGCGEQFKTYTNCTCLGVQKYEFLGTQCIGIKI